MIALLLVCSAWLLDFASSENREINIDVLIVGAGYAGLSAANYLHKSNVSFHVLEANSHVGGRTRNFDLDSGQFDVISDSVVELGGTFVSPGHTRLINLVKETGLNIFNTSGKRYRGAHLNRKNFLKEPSITWPWWWSGVDTQSKMAPSVFHSFKGSFFFSTPADLKRNMDEMVFAELEVAGKLMATALENIPCDVPGSAWNNFDSITFEAWIREHTQFEESRTILRIMCRGMIAQEASEVSLLYTMRSLKGCWSTGDDDQFRIRGGSQAPLLNLWHRFEDNISLRAPVARITPSLSSQDPPWHAVTKSGGISVMAKHVIVTGPPSTVLGIDMPSLSWSDAQLLQRMPLGTSLKYFLIYTTPWWRLDGNLSGQVLATHMPKGLNVSQANDGFYACMDHSAYDGLYKAGKGALMCWIEGEVNLHFLSTLSDKQRKEHIVAFLELSYRESRALSPEAVIEYNWASQPYSRGAYTMFFPPGVQSQPAFWNAYGRAEKAAGLWLAGSDYQVGYGNGYIEGAVRSGEAVAATIVNRFKTHLGRHHFTSAHRDDLLV